MTRYKPHSVLHQLRSATSDERLSTSLLDVANALDDDQAAAVIDHLVEQRRLESLGDLLSIEMTQLLEQNLTGRLRAQLRGSLERWLEEPEPVCRRHKPRHGLKVVEPPQDPAAALRWAKRRGLAEHLGATARRVRPWLGRRSVTDAGREDPLATIGDLIGGLRLPRGVPSNGHVATQYRSAARSYLVYADVRRRLQLKRDELWATRPPTAALRILSIRLRDIHRTMDAAHTAQPVLLRGEEYLRVQSDPACVQMSFPTHSASDVQVEIRFAGYEDGPLKPIIVGADTNPRRSPYLRAVVEWTLDVVHDVEHPLHRAIRAALGAPTWARLVESLGDIIDTKATAAKDRLVWRVRSSERDLPAIDAAVQKRKRNGQWTRGAAVQPKAALSRVLPPRDATLVDSLLAAQMPGLSSAVVASLHARALTHLVGHPHVFDDSGEPLRVVRSKPEVTAELAERGARITVALGGAPVAALRSSALQCSFVRGEDDIAELHLASLSERSMQALRLLEENTSVIPREGYDRLLNLLTKLQPEVSLRLPESLRGNRVEAATDLVARVRMDGQGLSLDFGVRPLPQGPTWRAGEEPQLVVGLSQGSRAHALRDLKLEASSVEEARAALSPLLPAPEAGGHRVEGLERCLHLVERLQQVDGLAVEWLDDSWRVDAPVGSNALRVSVTRAGDWFGVEGHAELDGTKIPLRLLLQTVRRDERYVRVGTSRFVRITDELREKLQQSSGLAIEGDEVRAAVAAVPQLADRGVLADEAAQVKNKQFKIDQHWRAVLERAQHGHDAPVELPTNFHGELRDYQRQGFEWMARLASWGAGACLADEMGLGKTVQALVLMLHRADTGPALVVAPTSVCSAWLDEAARFAPDLRTVHYRGPKRKALLEEVGPGDLVVTSYDILARDIEALEALPLGTLVLDEAQSIKNANTRRAKAAARLNAGWRVALSGTPLENHLGELWSLYRVISPGMLGGWTHFRRRYAVPIERDGNSVLRSELQDRIRPFLLRRTKRQVAPELPPRTDVVMPVELSEAERTLYEAARRDAAAGLASKGRFDVLAAITRLRLLACNPRLVDPSSTLESAKLQTALELIDELQQEGHRALVFSQFTSHLALLREALELRGTSLLYLDGRTPQRHRPTLVAQWQATDVPVFLISLKAGGTGLTLTAADYVVHLDPWWNPAVEDQASDRAHRIGQDKPVTVVRLVTQDTIEESVLSLHARKRGLAEALLEGGDVAGRLSAEELLRLVQ